jgi:hypothetical protein
MTIWSRAKEKADPVDWTNWTGPRDDDLLADGLTVRPSKVPLPPERWPYGPPSFHEACCSLFGVPALNRCGFFCDCKASDESEE